MNNISQCLLWPAQVSPACSLWEQSVWFFRERGQSHRWISFPLHSTLFSHTTPSPAPKTKFLSALSAAPQPICLQTTWASLMSHWSSQTEPHTALWYTSSLPEHRPSPPLSLRGTWSKTHQPALIRNIHIKVSSCVNNNKIIINILEHCLLYGDGEVEHVRRLWGDSRVWSSEIKT